MEVLTAQPVDELAAAANRAGVLGAVFLTYALSPGYFEGHILRAVLRLSSDPEEHPARYLTEATERLREVPVCVIADPRVRAAGRRLPYDVLDYGRGIFHPKVVLLVGDKHAHLQVGSGNLTEAGYGKSTELFFRRDLSYDRGEDVAQLRATAGWLREIDADTRQGGSQLARVLGELEARLDGAPAGDPDEAGFRLIRTTDSDSTFEQLWACLPEGAAVQRIGVMAPFFEPDDATPDLDEAHSLLLSLARETDHPVALDVGVLWDDPPLRWGGGEIPEISERLGELWAWKTKTDDGDTAIEYFTPVALGQRQLRCRDARGRERRYRAREVEAALEGGALWPVGTPTILAPLHILGAAAELVPELSLWLHPANRWTEQRIVRRPLHAKLLTITYRAGRRVQTVILVGSANASRRALLRALRGGGNVEAGAAFILDGEIRLPDVCPELVLCQLERARAEERVYPSEDVNYAFAVLEAVHDPGERTLRLRWDHDAARTLPVWELCYGRRRIDAGNGVPAADTVVSNFGLEPGRLELDLIVKGNSYQIPILVTDLAQLPLDQFTAGPSLHEMLLLLGRRVNRERLVYLRERAGDAGDGVSLETIFGDGFGPTDVFRAWWGAAAELAPRDISFPTFRLRLEGTLGVAPVWTLMKEAHVQGSLTKAETWLYGAELLRTLKRTLDSDERPLGDERKRKLLQAFLAELRSDLESLGALDPAAWLDPIREFYGVGG